MKQFRKSFVAILLAGTCTGFFVYARFLPAMRVYAETGTDSSIIWAFAPLSRLLAYVLFANLALTAVWLLFSWMYALYSGKEFGLILRLDALTYLPLCFLGLSVLQFNSLLTYYFEGLYLFTEDIGFLLPVIALMAVFFLKIRYMSGGAYSGGKVQQTQDRLSRKTVLAVFVVSLVIYILVGFRFVGQLGLGGDEPHYLLITHSLLYDHDLAINNNYKQRDYAPFFQAHLDVHVSIGKDGTRYSIHPIGMPILMLPAYALNTWPPLQQTLDTVFEKLGLQAWDDLIPFLLCLLFMNLIGALLALCLFLIAFALTRNRRLALILWGVISFTPPLLLYSTQMYPETPSALLIAICYYLICFGDSKKLSHALLLAFSLAYLPWLQQRMILATILLGAYHLYRWFMAERDIRMSPQYLRFTGIPLIVLTLSGVLMAVYYAVLFGNPLPNAPYVSIGMQSVFSPEIFFQEGLLGLFLDQEGGLLIFAPYLVFAFVGLIVMLRRQTVHGLFILLVIISIYIPCAGFTLKWRGAWSPAARYMIGLMPILFVPFCAGIQHARRRIDRYIFVFLVLLGALWGYRFLHTPFSSILWNHGLNRTFQEMSNLLDLTRYFPSFTPESTAKFPIALLWMLLIALFSIWVYRGSVTSKKGGMWDSIFTADDMRPYLKQVFGFYGILLLSGLLVTFSASRFQEGTIPYTAKNRYLREFLSGFRHQTIARNQLTQEQPLAQEELRFEYINREKYAEVNQKYGERFIVSGPRDPYEKGKYTVYFTMWIEENSSDQVVATLDVAAFRGSQVFNRKSVRASDFSASGTYQMIPLSFELPQDVTDLETRVFFHNRVAMRVKKVYIEPDLAELYYDSGVSALHKNRFEEAKTFFSRAASFSGHPQALYQLARLAQKEEDWSASIPLLQSVLERKVDCPDVYYRLGNAFFHKGELEKAQEYLERAVTFLPTHLDAWTLLHEAYQQLEMPQAAKSASETIRQLYSPQHEYRVNFSNELMFLGYSVKDSEPGQLHIEYYWKALSPMDRDYTFFVHFKNSSTTFQQDHNPHIIEPSSGALKNYPTSQWKIGELIREEYVIPAPSGRFRGQIGVWDTKTRLPIMSSDSGCSFLKDTTLELQAMTIP